MKRKVFTLMLALVMACALIPSAFADVMWEPIGNSFYEAHRDECQYVDRSYLANGPQGYVTLRQSPETAGEAYNVPNGENVYVGYTWTAADGSQWCACEYALPREDGEGWDWKDGWVPVSEVALIYDYLCFEEDHGEEFAAYDGSGDELTKVCLYSYPGGVYEWTLEEDRDYQPFSEAFQNLYTDGDGRRWTQLGYYMGRQNSWVCIDDPLSESLGVDAPQTAAAVRGTGDEALIPSAVNVPEAAAFPVWILPAGLVIAATAATALLMRKRTPAKG